MAWARQMDEGPNPGENEKPGGATGLFFAVRMKKKGAGSLAGLVARDALIGYTYTDEEALRVVWPDLWMRANRYVIEKIPYLTLA
jgi:hypothetical protein